MVKRSRVEMYFDILEVIERGVTKPTHIMFKTYLDWVTLQEIFETLIKSGFIKEERKGNTRTYKVTGRGSSALSYYLKASDGLSKAEAIFNT